MRRGLVLLAALVGACAASPVAPPASRPDPCPTGPSTAFVDVTVVPMDAERLVAGQTVLVCGERIVAVGPRERLAVPPTAHVIPGGGRYLMPGLVDAHTHLVRQEDLLLYLARGVTTVRNMWGAPRHLEWRERIARGEARGPTIVTAGPLIDGDPPGHDGSLIVRTPAEADAAVALHRQAGYDFLKVYGGLTRPAYERLLQQAHAAGLAVAGHVPRAVGLVPAAQAGQRSVEHLDGFLDALQAAGSPVRGRWDGASRRRKLDFVDETKLPDLARLLRERGVFVCPTMVVKESLAPAAEVRPRAHRPAARYVPPCERAIWEPEDDPPAAVLAGFRRSQALSDRWVVALRDAGVGLVVGTDPANPLVVPGFSVHDELRHFVRVGLTPYQALRAATRDAAAALGGAGAFGVVAVGQRADLLLVDGNPLADVAQAGALRGVMARGRWFEPAALQAMLTEVAAAFADGSAPFAGRPPWAETAPSDFAATYRISWKGAPFGAERLLVVRAPSGRRIRAETFDPHTGQTVTLLVEDGGAEAAQRIVLESDGATGRGRAEAVRRGRGVSLRGRLLSGPEFREEVEVEPGAVLVAPRVLAHTLLLLPRLAPLAVGQSTVALTREVALGSKVEVTPRPVRLARLPDLAAAGGPRRRFELRPEGGPPSTLTLDQSGWPASWELPAHGATVRFERVE